MHGEALYFDTPGGRAPISKARSRLLTWNLVWSLRLTR